MIIKNIVITGASRGIGKEIALYFAERGFNIAFCARTKQDVDALAQTLREFQVDVIAKAVDVRNVIQIKDFALEVLSAWGSIDILVNNAGTYLPGRVIDEKEGTLETLIETNLYSAYYFSRAFAPNLVEQKKGHIFNIASVAGQQAYPNGGSYSISKFAMIGLSKALREELKQQNIKVTTISPGPVFTDSWASAGIPEERFIPASDIGKLVFDLYHMSETTVIEDLTVRPILGDI
jgi:NADP-dependent 3-hydroxy acid dehydrogenase YdfG